MEEKVSILVDVEYGDECDAGIAFADNIVEGKVYWEANPTVVKSSLCTNCIICDSPIDLSPNEALALEHGHNIVKVCDECKKAIMYVKNHIEAEIAFKDDPRAR